ncbi:MAG: thioredoxin domain-containing protein [Desulfovibrionaceae bacterium]|nr:thioredoxin domain-containing protein [Desulfovibrionaceae bacterium]
MKPAHTVLGALAALSLAFGAGPAQAAAPTAQELRPALEQLLRENPEVLLDFMREHCESLLDIVQQGSDQRRLANFEAQWAHDVKEPKKVATRNRPRMGSSNARVQIISFSDFTCQYCLRAEKTIEEVLNEYKGKVSFIFKNMPLERNGLGGLASNYYIAISMLDEDKAWEFYMTMFKEREALLLNGEKFMRETAQKIGVDMKKMDSLRRGKEVAAILNEDLQDADNLHIEGTPYFLVNNLVIRGAVPKDVFRRAIELELERTK